MRRAIRGCCRKTNLTFPLPARVGTVHDSAIVKKVNVIHHVTPIGQCSGSKTWTFMENIPALSSGFTINGDVIMRLHADVAAAPCVGDCEGRQCGDDGCGESCGTCTPCRVGVSHLHDRPDRGALERLLTTLEMGSLCGFGQGVPKPIRDLLHAFPKEMDPCFRAS